MTAAPTRRLRREQRLRTAADFARLRDDGLRLNCGPFFLQFRLASAESAAAPKLGVIASRKVGNAVVRNLAKRRLRALFQQHQSLLPLGSELVLIARDRLPGTDFSELEERFRRALRRIERTLAEDS